MIKQKLKIPNPAAHDLGEMFGISLKRRNELADQLDQMVHSTTGMVYASSVLRKIESFVNTREEFTWALINHMFWMAKNNRVPYTHEDMKKYIDKFGQPKNLDYGEKK